MRILITSTGSWGTGSFTVINALTREFLKMGHNVKVFFPDSGVPSNDMAHYYNNPELYEIWKFPIEKNSTELITFPLMIPDPHPRNPVKLTFKDLSDNQFQLYFDECKARIKKVIDEFQPDIIECQHVWCMAHIIQELGFPYFITAHNSDQLGYSFDKRMRPFADNAAVNAKYIFTISDYVKKEVLELHNISQETIIVLPNGYNKTVFKKQVVDREEFLTRLGVTIPTEAKIITFAGKISHTKGMDTILEANCILNNPNIHFLIFGAGDIKNIISNCTHRYSMERVHFVGHRPPIVLAQAHNIAKISIMPSRSEGFGIAGLEAMGCGLPIIVTKNTGLESFAVGGFIEATNSKQLAEAILTLLDLSESQYNNLSNKAETTAQEYSWDVIAEKRLYYYQNI